MARPYCVIEIYTNEGARCHGQDIPEAVISYVRKLKTSARCAVFKGVEGCYENGEVSTRKIMDLSLNQPVKIEIVLPAVEATDAIADLQDIVCEGILGTRELLVISHRTRKRLFPPQTRVKDVMTAKPASVTIHESVDRIMKTLLSANFTGMPVVDSEKRPVGVISQSDLIYRAGMPVRLALMEQSDTEKMKAVMAELSTKIARDIMTKPAIFIQESDLLTHAVDTMLKKKVKRLPVVDDAGFLTGIVSRLDIFQTVTRTAPDWERMKKHDVHIGNMRYVDEIMRRDVQKVGPDTPISDVLGIIDSDDIQRVVVVDRDGRLMGLISDRNLLSAFADEAPGVWNVLSRLAPFSTREKHTGKTGTKLENQQARTIMETDLITIREKDGIEEAISIMTDRGIKRLPVVNDMHIFKGMISRADLLKEGFSAMKDLTRTNDPL